MRVHRPVKLRRLSRKGLTMIADFEGFRARAYKPVSTERYWTIGYGHYGPDVKPGATISRAAARRMLRNDAKSAARAVRSSVKGKMTQGEYDALVSFTFNCGAGALRESTLLKKFNAGDHKGAANELLRWNKAGGRELEGLTRRRKAERNHFLKR